MCLWCGSAQARNIQNVTLDDVRVEDMRGVYEHYMFLLQGTAKNIYVNNFSVFGGRMLPSLATGDLSDVTFNNLNYFGKLITDADAGQFSGSGFGGVSFTTVGFLDDRCTRCKTWQR